MPLKNPKTQKAASDSLAAMPEPSALVESYQRLPPTRFEPEPEPEDPERDAQWYSWQYAEGNYGRIVDAVENFPVLMGDADMSAAVSAFRNAERAIKARAKELLGG